MCNLCGSPGVHQTNADHIQPRFVGGEDALDNLQIICTTCHASKTTLGNLSFVEDEHPLLSRFSLETYSAFVEAAKPPQLVANLREMNIGAISVDIVRSRFNAFTGQDAYDLLVYCPCDNIEPCSNELGDYRWVDGGLDGRLSVLSVLPYFGPGWYGRGSVAFMLDAGIITWRDVKTTYNASARRPVSYVADRLKAL